MIKIFDDYRVSCIRPFVRSVNADCLINQLTADNQFYEVFLQDAWSER